VRGEKEEKRKERMRGHAGDRRGRIGEERKEG
jgi:hypothetical protein